MCIVFLICINQHYFTVKYSYCIGKQQRITQKQNSWRKWSLCLFSPFLCLAVSTSESNKVNLYTFWVHKGTGVVPYKLESCTVFPQSVGRQLPQKNDMPTTYTLGNTQRVLWYSTDGPKCSSLVFVEPDKTENKKKKVKKENWQSFWMRLNHKACWK